MKREEGQARLARFFELVAGGKSLAAAAKVVGVSRMTGTRWMEQQRERSAAEAEKSGRKSARADVAPLTPEQVAARVAGLVGPAIDHLADAMDSELVPAQTRAQCARAILGIAGYTPAAAEAAAADARAEAATLRKARAEAGEQDPLDALEERAARVLTPVERELLAEIADKVRRASH